MKKSLLSVLIMMLGTWTAFAQVPTTISYQGILIDNSTGNPLPDGTSNNVRFVFYDAPSAGSIVHQTQAFSVTTYKGLFTTVIGNSLPSAVANPPIPTNIWDSPIFVEVFANSTSLGPRIPLTTAPFSFKAESANSVAAAGITGTIPNAVLDADLQDLSDGTLTGSKVGTGIAAGNITSGTLALANGGTGAATAAAARTNLGLGTLSTLSTVTAAEITDATIGSGDLADNSVTTAKIVDGTIASGDLANSGVTAGSFGSATQVGTFTVDAKGRLTLAGNATISGVVPGGTAGGDLTGTFPNPTVGTGAISSAKILDGTIAVGDLADGAVTSAKILDGTIAAGDLADGAVTSAKILDATIASADLADNSVTTTELADNAVTTAEIGTAGAGDANKVLTTDGSGNPQWELKTAVGITGTGTAGQLAFWGGASSLTADANLFWDNTNKRLGLGVTNPEYVLQIRGNGGVENDILLESLGAAASSGSLTLRRARGTAATPTAALAGDALGNVLFGGYTGATYNYAGNIATLAETDFNVGANAAITFNTASAGTISERMRLTSAGFLGIGTIAPVDKVHVHASTATGVRSRLTNVTTGTTLFDGFSMELGSDGLTTYLWNYENGPLRIGTNNLDRMLIDAAGNVGIGTTSPSFKLDVRGPSTTTINVDGGATSDVWTYYGQNGTFRGAMGIRNGGVMTFFNGGDRMVINNLGLVGIGTTSPSSLLHINNISSSTSPNGIYINNDYNGVTQKNGLQVDVSATGTGVRYGIEVDVSGSSTASTVYGLETDVNPNGSTATVYGVNSSVTASGASGSRYGVYSIVGTAAGTSSGMGVYGQITGSGTGTHYGVYGYANGAGTNYGVYGYAPVAEAGYAVFSDGHLIVGGNITYTGTITDISDERIKRDIQPMPSMLSKVLQLKPSKFYFRTDEYKFMSLSKEMQLGLIAQEVEEVFPEVVTDNTYPEEIDKEGKVVTPSFDYKGIDYTLLIPILIKSVQEQQGIIDQQNSSIAQLKTELDELRKMVMANQKPAEPQKTTASVGNEK